MNQSAAARAVAAFQFKGSLLPFTTMELSSADPSRIAAELPSVVAQAPGFFEQAPVILGVEKVAASGLDLEALCALLRAERLLPIGVRGGGDDVRAASHALGLAWFPAESAPKRPAVARRQEASDEPPARVGRTHRGTVRSGQQIAALSGDLIILGAVNPGAEVLAAGNVHVYGPLRGRALAGIHGDAEAGIFCRALEAELVSVAGNYKRREDIDQERIGRAAEIRWRDEQLWVLALD